MMFPSLNLKTRQQGAATLIVVMVLAIVMAVVSMTTARTGIMEQKIVGNDLRAREVQEAAEAGLEYGVAWAKNNSILNDVICSSEPFPAGCPTALTTVTGSSTGERYSYTLTYTIVADSIRVTSAAQGETDNSIAATSEAFVKQIPKGLFDFRAKTPPPWTLAGCITTAATGNPDTFVLHSTNDAVISGTSSSAACLPQGHLDVGTWNDTNENGVMDYGEYLADSTTFNKGTFTGCPSTNCAWNMAFKMSLQDTKDMAAAAGHTYAGSIPCGPAASSPSIYLVNNSGPFNGADISGACTGTGVDGDTIGTPSQPVILIIPSSAGCPKFNGGVTIYGIIYYESTTACASQGWGGATVYGSVIWEGNIEKPNANSVFIEVDYEDNGDLNTVFNIGIDDAARIPGTWKDF